MQSSYLHNSYGCRSSAIYLLYWQVNLEPVELLCDWIAIQGRTQWHITHGWSFITMIMPRRRCRLRFGLEEAITPLISMSLQLSNRNFSFNWHLSFCYSTAKRLPAHTPTSSSLSSSLTSCFASFASSSSSESLSSTWHFPLKLLNTSIHDCFKPVIWLKSWQTPCSHLIQ